MGWMIQNIILKDVLEQPLNRLPVSYCWMEKCSCWQDSAFIWHFPEHPNWGVYILAVFDARQTTGSPHDVVPVQSANGKNELFIPHRASCPPPPQFSCSNTFTTAESTKWYNGFAIRAAFIACKQVLGIIFSHSYSCYLLNWMAEMEKGDWACEIGEKDKKPLGVRKGAFKTFV